MPVFVHLTPEDNIKNIERNGLKVSKIHYDSVNKGIFCMPVIDDFYSTHQWLREIKRFCQKSIAGIYFKVPEEEPVLYGFYNKEQKLSNAGLAVKTFIESNERQGFQVIITRKILSKDITRIKYLPQVIGWRYFPSAHGKKQCLCPACLVRGEYKSTVVKEQRYSDLISRLHQAKEEEIANILMEINSLLDFSNGRIKEYQMLLPYLESNSNRIIICALNTLSNFRDESLFKRFLEYLEYDDFDVKNTTADVIFKIKGKNALEYLKSYEEDEDLKEIIREYKEIYEE